jgi:hypothetical protein
VSKRVQATPGAELVRIDRDTATYTVGSGHWSFSTDLKAKP